MSEETCDEAVHIGPDFGSLDLATGAGGRLEATHFDRSWAGPAAVNAALPIVAGRLRRHDDRCARFVFCAEICSICRTWVANCESRRLIRDIAVRGNTSVVRDPRAA